MRIRAVTMTVGADEARNTACRLTVPVPDGSRRAKTISAALGCGRRRLTPAMLGVG